LCDGFAGHSALGLSRGKLSAFSTLYVLNPGLARGLIPYPAATRAEATLRAEPKEDARICIVRVKGQRGSNQ